MSKAQNPDSLEMQLADVDARIEELREGVKECEARCELMRSKLKGLEELRAKVAALMGKQPA